MQKLEVTLHYSVLTRRPVNRNIRVIEHHELAIHQKIKVVFINGSRGSVFKMHVPIESFHVDNIDIIALFIKERVQTLSRTH